MCVLHKYNLSEITFLKLTNVGWMLFSERQNDAVFVILISSALNSSIEQI